MSVYPLSSHTVAVSAVCQTYCFRWSRTRASHDYVQLSADLETEAAVSISMMLGTIVRVPSRKCPDSHPRTYLGRPLHASRRESLLGRTGCCESEQWRKQSARLVWMREPIWLVAW